MKNNKMIIPPKPSEFAELQLFKMIWFRSTKRSFITDLVLRDYEGTDFWVNMFAHVLAKGMNKYPYFKYYAKNIILLTPNEHHLLDNGTEEQRISYSLDVEEKSGGKNTANWGKIKTLEEELKIEYKESFPTTKGLIIGYKYDIYEQQKIVGELNRKFFGGK
jgi:hypothetical protein